MSAQWGGLGTYLGAYGVLILAGFLPNEIWRMLGIVAARGLNEDAEIIIWVRGIATAILAGVIARLIVLPPGALAMVPLPVRLGAIVIGFLGFAVMRSSVLAGVIIGEAALVAGSIFYGM